MALPKVGTLGIGNDWLKPLFKWLDALSWIINAFTGNAWYPVRAMTAAALPANTWNLATNTKTANANGALTINGVAMQLGDRFWDKDDATGLRRGAYIVQNPGSASTPWVVQRTTDADASGEFALAKKLYVGEGSNGGKTYALTNATFVLNTDTPAVSVYNLDLRARFLAFMFSTPHMDPETPTGLTALAGGASQATADARYTALRASLLAHFAHTGASGSSAGVHLAPDTVNGATMGTAPNGVLATLITCIGEMKTALIAGGHADEAGVHGNVPASGGSDPVLAAMTLPVDPPVTLANCVTDLNTMLAAIDAHYAFATPV